MILQKPAQFKIHSGSLRGVPNFFRQELPKEIQNLVWARLQQIQWKSLAFVGAEKILPSFLFGRDLACGVSQRAYEGASGYGECAFISPDCASNEVREHFEAVIMVFSKMDRVRSLFQVSDEGKTLVNSQSNGRPRARCSLLAPEEAEYFKLVNSQRKRLIRCIPNLKPWDRATACILVDVHSLITVRE